MAGPLSAREMWALIEPVHAVTYFAPEARSAFERAGLRGFWRGYFAGRAAPLGTVGPEPVIAAFFGFAPGMVARAVPSVWAVTPPADALRTRQAGAARALRRLLAAHGPAVEEVAALLAPLTSRLDCAGRVLAAANCALDPPIDPAELLWHTATLLREHRGDGHVAALVAGGFDGCEILVLRAGIDIPRAELQPYRGWTDEQWDAARRRLTDRGLLDPHGRATDDGLRAHAELESATDRAAQRPWQALPAPTADRLSRLLPPLASACASALRYPNPMGLPEPGRRLRGVR